MQMFAHLTRTAHYCYDSRHLAPAAATVANAAVATAADFCTKYLNVHTRFIESRLVLKVMWSANASNYGA